LKRDHVEPNFPKE